MSENVSGDFKTILKKIFPNNDEYRYLMTALSQIFDDHDWKYRKKLYIFNGKECNGKSTIISLVMEILKYNFQSLLIPSGAEIDPSVETFIKFKCIPNGNFIYLGQFIGEIPTKIIKYIDTDKVRIKLDYKDIEFSKDDFIVIDFPTTCIFETDQVFVDPSITFNMFRYKDQFNEILKYHHQTYKFDGLNVPNRFKEKTEKYLSSCMEILSKELSVKNIESQVDPSRIKDEEMTQDQVDKLLFSAVNSKDLNLVKLVMRYKPNIQYKENADNAFPLAAQNGSDDINPEDLHRIPFGDIIDYFIEQGYDKDRDNQSIIWALTSGQIRIAEKMESMGFKFDMQEALEVVAYGFQMESINYLINVRKVKFDQNSPNLNKTLHHMIDTINLFKPNSPNYVKDITECVEILNIILKNQNICHKHS